MMRRNYRFFLRSTRLLVALQIHLITWYLQQHHHTGTAFVVRSFEPTAPCARTKSGTPSGTAWHTIHRPPRRPPWLFLQRQNTDPPPEVSEDATRDRRLSQLEGKQRRRFLRTLLTSILVVPFSTGGVPVVWSSSSSIAGAEETEIVGGNAEEEEITKKTDTAGNTPLRAERVGTKPFAPLENLLPAMRVKVSIDDALELTKTLVTLNTTNSSDSPTTREELLTKLETLLLQPQTYVHATDPSQVVPYTQDKTGIPSQPAALYLQSYQSVPGDLPLQKALIQTGDVDAWKRLKRREKTLEQASAIRTAFNTYTDAVSFSSQTYVLNNINAQIKSTMIREGRLPEMKQVITSDMGVRYLYRNQVLTSMEEAEAELVYQRTSSNNHTSARMWDGTELVELLTVARDAMERWLSLVPSEDVAAALKIITTSTEIADISN